MKKLVSMLLAVTLCVTVLIGCSSDDNKYEKGILSENSFESKFLDLRFTLPEGYIMATEADIKEMIAADNENVAQGKIDYALLSTVYEMMASHVTNNPNVIVMSEKLTFSNMTIEQYFEASAKQLTEMGVTSVSAIQDTTLAGNTFQKMTAVIEAYGMSMYQDYVLRKQGNRVIGFVFTYTSDTKSEVEALADAFTKY
ncbi:MAG: hypothetical protein FWC09_06845 [Lachnospiraceae bacterium]|nr:hypothetical protein [Lachnospiraceae bacterium]